MGVFESTLILDLAYLLCKLSEAFSLRVDLIRELLGEDRIPSMS